MPKTTITANDRKMFLRKALKAADWFVNSQFSHPKQWMADNHRFLYYYNMKQKKYVPGLNWTMGRALFTLTEAYKLTGKKQYLESAELGARWIRALQPLDPHYPLEYGVYREESPQCAFGGILDGAQAASGMLLLHEVTGNPDYLRSGKAFCDFLHRTWCDDVGFPHSVNFFPPKVNYGTHPIGTIAYATAIPLWHLHRITGERQYLPMILKSADAILVAQREDGGINCWLDCKGMVTDENHHHGRGEGDEKYLLRNDDGLVTVVLAAYKITGDKKYLKAMVKYADWTVANEPHQRPFNAFGIQAANVYDIAKVARKNYDWWFAKNIKKYCLDLQVSSKRDMKAFGGFRGEDEEGEGGVFGGKSLDYVPTRNTCYMAGLLFRLSGKGTGSGFSVFGLPK